MREIRLEVVPKPEPGTATVYEKSEQLGDQPYLIGDGEERNENRRFYVLSLIFVASVYSSSASSPSASIT